jgi:predicted amidohydrolase
MYDLLLKGGSVVDAASGLDGVLDVAIEGIAAGEAARVVEVGGKLVTPG